MTSPKQSPDAVVVSEPVVTREHRLAAHEVMWPGVDFDDDVARKWASDGKEPAPFMSWRIAARIAKALATIEHNARPKWIPVSENAEHPVPKIDQVVLFRLSNWPDGSVCMGELNDETGMWESEETDDDGNPRWSYGRFEVAGWFPIPPPPTGASDA